MFILSDGFIGKDALIKIKCPYLAQNTENL